MLGLPSTGDCLCLHLWYVSSQNGDKELNFGVKLFEENFIFIFVILRHGRETNDLLFTFQKSPFYSKKSWSTNIFSSGKNEKGK